MNGLRRVSVLVALVGLLGTACAADPIVVTDPDLGAMADVEAPEVTGADGTGSGEASENERGATGADDPGAVDPDTSAAPDLDVQPEEGAGPDEGTTDAADTSAGVASLVRAVDTTESQTSFRYELRVGLAMSDLTFAFSMPPDTPLATGAYAGGVSSSVLDFQPMFETMFEDLEAEGPSLSEVFGDDITMSMIDDASGRLYLKSPMFAALAGTDGLPESFSALADGWGVIDIGAVAGLTPTQVSQLAGGQTGATPEALLSLARTAEDVQEIGGAAVRGVDTKHFRVDVELADLIAAQGMTIDEVEELMGSVESVLSAEVPFDIFIDADDRVRRVIVTLDLDTIDALSEGRLPAGAEFSMTSTVDFFDYGTDIAIDVPTGEEIVVDLTADFEVLFG